jgi:hypothetical protein
MIRSIACASVLGIVVSLGALFAQEPIRQGKIVKIDAEKNLITIQPDSGDPLDCAINDETRIMGTNGRAVKERLKDSAVKVDVRVMFRVAKRDGTTAILDGLRLVDPDQRQVGPGDGAGRVVADTSGLVPLTELGSKKYQDVEGGLYPGGENSRPAEHEAAGVGLARRVQPLDSDGKPARDGKIGLLSIGMSNTSQEFTALQQLARGDRDLNPQLVLVNGAQGGMTAAAIQDPGDKARGTKFWRTVDERLRAAGVTPNQIQAVWLKQADAGPSSGFPKYARTLESELQSIAQVLHDRFPNLKLVYLSSRIYAGYASTRLNPEPYAYESAFAVKWLIERQLKGEPSLNFDQERGAVKAPWLGWGPYLWANGTAPRQDGLRYEERDFAQDGTHPSSGGQKKVAEQLLKFFKTDTTTRQWFLNRAAD